MHKLSRLEERKLDILVSNYLSTDPLAIKENPLAGLTETIKMCVHATDLAGHTPASDPAWMHLAQTAMDLRKTTNFLARSMTQNTRDLAVLIEPNRAVSYSLDTRDRHVEKLKYVRDLADITGCKFVLNGTDFSVGYPWKPRCCWLLPSEETDMQTLTDFLRSENIPFEYEAKSLLDALGYGTHKETVNDQH